MAATITCDVNPLSTILETFLTELYFIVSNCFTEVERQMKSTKTVMECNILHCTAKVENVTDEICENFPPVKYFRKFIMYKDTKLTRIELENILDHVFEDAKFESVSDLNSYRSRVEKHIVEYGRSVKDAFTFTGNITKDECAKALKTFESKAKIIKNEELSKFLINEYENLPIIKSTKNSSENLKIRIWRNDSEVRFIFSETGIVAHYKNQENHCEEMSGYYLFQECDDSDEELISPESSPETSEILIEYNKDIDRDVDNVEELLYQCYDEIMIITDKFLDDVIDSLKMCLQCVCSSIVNLLQRLIDHVAVITAFSMKFVEKMDILYDIKSLIAKLNDMKTSISKLTELYGPLEYKCASDSKTVIEKVGEILDRFLKTVHSVVFYNISHIKRSLARRCWSEFDYEYSLEAIEAIEGEFNVKKAIAKLMFGVKLEIAEFPCELENCMVVSLELVMDYLKEIELNMRSFIEEIQNCITDIHIVFRKWSAVDKYASLKEC